MPERLALVSQLTTEAHSVVRLPTARSGACRAPLVLIADADETSRTAREHQLRLAGFRVAAARTGFEAIVKASCQLPDIILVDDSLSDMRAPEVGSLLTTCPVTAHIPVVRLLHGRRLPQRLLSRLRRAAI